jgi:Origin of replication binding protein
VDDLNQQTNKKFEYYMDINSGTIDPTKHPFLIIQINSVKRIFGGVYDIIVLDELSYVLDTFISFCKQRFKIMDNLRQLLLHSNKNVILDAYLT